MSRRIRIRSWWRRHWWPARIRQLDQERSDWQRWCLDTENALADCRAAALGGDDE